MARTSRLALTVLAGVALLMTGSAAFAEPMPMPTALELRVVVDDCPKVQP